MPIEMLTETELLKVFDKSYIGMTITSPDGHFIKVNPYFCYLMGYTSEELVGQSFKKITHPDDIDLSDQQVKLLVSGQNDHFEIEKRYLHKNGHIVYTLLNSTMIRDAQQKPLYFIVHIKDITHLKKALEELRVSEEKFRLIFEKAPMAIGHFDKEGNITAFNQTLLNILGSTREKVENVNTKRDLKNEAHMSALQEALSGKMSYYEGEYASFTGTKTSYLKTIYAPFFDKEGKVVGGISMSEDITERKQSERKIKTALKEKELLIKEVYHRAKNNLQTTISLINIQMSESNNPELISALKETQNRLFAMANVHEVLCKTENLDNILLRDYIKDLISNYSYAKISYQTNVEETLALTVDQTNAIGLILNELITNSIKHNLAHDIVIKINVHRNLNNKIEFDYSDNGIGLPEDSNFSKSALGMNLVQVLVEDQLDGELDWLEEKGFHLLIKF